MTEILPGIPSLISGFTQSINPPLYVLSKNEISRPFTISNPTLQLSGYIDDGYTIDPNGICTGNLITVEGSRTVNTTKVVSLLAIENKESYNLNSINDPLQILVMSKDNKYIFLYPNSSLSNLSFNDIFGQFMSLVSLIFAIKIYNISIPLITDYELLYNASINSLYKPIGIDPNLPSYKIILQKMIMLADAPDTDPSNLLDKTKVKTWSDLYGLLKSFNKLYDIDTSNLCISYIASDINTIPNNILQFDCRNTEKLNTNELKLNDKSINNLLNELINESNNNNNNSSFFSTPIGIGVIIILILIIIIIIVVFFNNKSSMKSNDLTSSGGYYYF